jgi:outer membrane immunogenic protein
MRHFGPAVFATTVLSCGFAHNACTADVPAPPIYSYYRPGAVAVPNGWTGPYLGVNIGYGWSNVSNDWTLWGFAPASERQNMNGAIGGFQSGFNWQLGAWVLGTESDFQASGQKGTTTYCIFACAVPAFLVNASAEHKMPWLGTARSRIGFLATDNILLYGTAGIAYGQIKSTYTINALANPVASLSFQDTRAGWTVGAGVEACFGAGWSAKLEYLYVDLSTLTNTINVIALGNVATWNNKVTDNVVRVGLNYRFLGR